MSRIALVTDSTAYIPQEYVQQYNITVAPQVLIWGDQTFEDGVDIQPDEFYRRLHKATVMPTTSQVTIVKFKQIFDDLLAQDCQILAILISTYLSGTISSAIQARDLLTAGAPIEIVDSTTTSMAMGYNVLAVARAIEQGASLQESVDLAKRITSHTGVVFAVDTLEFLHRGGRIGGGSRFLGTALNIKPILEVRQGKVEAVERVRTRKKSLTRLIELVEEQVKNDKPLRLATLHANVPLEAREVLEEAREKLGAVEAIISELSPVVGTHAGPGTLGLAYMVGF
ncbi:MAG: DegV family protein [Anaerolineales bacterium]|nr:DegV family protein [Anaerolineales bacterium]